MLRYWRVILLGVVASVFFTLYFFFNEETFALFWFFMSRVQLLWTKIFTVVTLWVKRFTLKYALTTGLIEGVKKFVIKVLLPSFLLSPYRRKIRALLERLKARLLRQRHRLVVWYVRLDRPVKVFIAFGAVLAVLVLSFFSWQLGLLILLFKIPGWITQPLLYFGYAALRWVQKRVIVILAFLGLFKVWGRMKAVLPESYLRRLRAADFRVKRRAIKSRRYTLSQFKKAKKGWGLWFVILVERFKMRKEVPMLTERELSVVEARERKLAHHETKKTVKDASKDVDPAE